MGCGFGGFVEVMRERGWDAEGVDPARAVADAATLRYLDGGGEGCTYPDDEPSFARRRFHHLTFYGFVLCFAATCTARL